MWTHLYTGSALTFSQRFLLLFQFSPASIMHFLWEGSANTAVEESGPASSFMQSILELPLCRDCRTLLKEFYESRKETRRPSNTMSGQKSEFDHMATKTVESCSLCFCMWQLLPFDLPQLTSITAFLRSGDLLDYAILQMSQGSRVLGAVVIDQFDHPIYPEFRYQQQLPTMDFQVISRLIRECEEQHLHRNWNLPRYQVPTSIQLIDVDDMMVIAATTQLRYLALSYVWGDHNSFATTTKIRKVLGKKGGLNQYMDEIPQTIKDSIDVVRNLGERYLWVDRLCIEQDNAIQKEAHIQKMDVIYSHALVTIIAHAGVAATSPLPGVRPGTRLRLPTTRIGDIVMSTASSGFWDSDAPHEKRGWTLQEQLLSKRCLYFDYHRTWFQCAKGVSAEDRPDMLIPAQPSFNIHDVQFNLAHIKKENGLTSVWKRYVDIIERYRARELRHAEDMIYAIQGVAQLISSSLETPLISAVPLRLLPRALLFYLRDEDYIGGRLTTAPSWSWAGWKTSIYFESALRRWHLSVEAVEMDMKFQYKPHSLTEHPNKGAPQSTGSELAGVKENPSVPTSLYMLLEIEAFSTNPSMFTIKSNPERSGVLYVHDQWGACCGHSHGAEPFISEEHYHSGQFQWILLSKSQPIPVSPCWASSNTYISAEVGQDGNTNISS